MNWEIECNECLVCNFFFLIINATELLVQRGFFLCFLFSFLWLLCDMGYEIIALQVRVMLAKKNWNWEPTGVLLQYWFLRFKNESPVNTKSFLHTSKQCNFRKERERRQQFDWNKEASIKNRFFNVRGIWHTVLNFEWWVSYI